MPPTRIAMRSLLPVCQEARFRRLARTLSPDPNIDTHTDEAATARYRAIIAAKLGKRP